MSSIDHGEAGRRHLERGDPDRAVRQLEIALEAQPHSAQARELLLEAYRCRNALYWALRGYWRWSVPQLARWLGLPVFAGLVLVVVAAECTGGLGIIPELPHMQPPNVVVQTVEVLAWLVGGVFVALREHKCVWVIDRVTTAWLVPAEVRGRLLDVVELASAGVRSGT